MERNEFVNKSCRIRFSLQNNGAECRRRKQKRSAVRAPSIATERVVVGKKGSARACVRKREYEDEQQRSQVNMTLYRIELRKEFRLDKT